MPPKRDNQSIGNDVAFWAGGTFSGAIYTMMNPDNLNPPTGTEQANFVVTHGGTVIANQAIIRGNIFADNGVFSGTVYASDGEFNGAVRIAGGKILLNKDGSGQLANGNITWSADGNLIVTGKYSSSETGNRFVINPDTSTLEMYSDNNRQICRFAFQDNGFAILSLWIMDDNGNITDSTTLTAAGSKFTRSVTINGGLTLNNTPTSSSGLQPGTIWNDNGTLKIVS